MKKKKKKDIWEHLTPVGWRTTLDFPSDSEKMEEVQRMVREDNGQGAFSLLKEIVEDDKESDDVRYRAMAMLVSLWGHRDFDKESIIEALENVVRSTLKPAWIQPRRDALTALALLSRNTWEYVPEALDFLLQLATDVGSNHQVRQDVLLALAETRSPRAIVPLWPAEFLSSGRRARAACWCQVCRRYGPWNGRTRRRLS